MPIKKVEFGKLEDDTIIYKYILTNGNNYEAHIITYGGILTNLYIPDKNGDRADVVLGFDNLAAYLRRHPYFGALIGRYANRIKKAKFTLDGQEYTLSANNGNNTVHGGTKGFDKRVWESSVEGDKLLLQYISEDGEEGYPGQLTTVVSYQLTPDNKLILNYCASTTKPTIVNLTNHSYFNLAGHDAGTLEELLLRVNAPHYTPVNSENIPTGEIKAVAGSVMDLTKDTVLGGRLSQVAGGTGFDHNFCFGQPGVMKHMARLHHPRSGRCMDMYSDEPGIQIYTGKNMLPNLEGKGGAEYKKLASICMEAQHYPDSPNNEKFPSVVLRPGDTYRQTTSYEFSIV